MYNPYASLDADEGSKSTVWLRHEDKNLILNVYGNGALTALLSTVVFTLANELRKQSITNGLTNPIVSRDLWFRITGITNSCSPRQDSLPDDRPRARKPRRRASKTDNHSDPTDRSPFNA